MKTIIVFSVVSGENDIYLSQAMTAAFSCRYYNPESTILLVVDEGTALLIEQKLSNIKKYINEIVIVETPQDYSKKLRSRYLKTTLRQAITGDFLFIDTDTIITESLESIDSTDADIAAVLDRHISVKEHRTKRKIEQDISSVDLILPDLHDKYFNSGVMFVRDTPISHKLFEKWHLYWNLSLELGSGIDQPALAKANKECGYPIVELSGIWNCQLCDNFVNYLHDAKILHYFASNNNSPYLLYSKRIFDEILIKGEISEELKYIIANTPKSYFVPNHLLVYGCEIPFLMTNLFKVYKFHKTIFGIFEYVARIIIRKKIF